MRVSDQEYNRLNVLRLLRRLEPISRTELAQVSDLTGASITQIIGDLVRRGLVLEQRVAPGGPGRPRVNLRLNPKGAFALSSYIEADGLLVSEIVDLRGEPVHQFTAEMPAIRTMDELAQTIVRVLKSVIHDAGLAPGGIDCIGLALPGVVDSRGGVVHWIQTITGTQFPMADLIQDAIGIPVTIDNGTNLLARAEHWFGSGQASESFTLINLGYGISASRYRDGSLHVGAHGLNSEMGHSKLIVEQGLLCACGARGCLDAYCSLTGLVRQLCDLEGEAMPGLADLSQTLARFIKAAERPDSLLRSTFARSGTYLGTVLANHINANDPGRIIILSEEWEMPEPFSAAVLQAIEANCLPPFRGITQIEFRCYDQDLFRRGAAALVLERMYRVR